MKILMCLGNMNILAGGTEGTLPEFVNFQLKIVLKATNKAHVPTIKDLRTIALSV